MKLNQVLGIKKFVIVEREILEYIGISVRHKEKENQLLGIQKSSLCIKIEMLEQIETLLP